LGIAARRRCDRRFHMKTRRLLPLLARLGIVFALATLVASCGAGIVKPGSVSGLCRVLADTALKLPAGQAADELFEEGVAVGCWKRS